MTSQRLGTMQLCAVAFAAALPIACDTPGQTPENRSTSWDSAGTEFVENIAPLWGPDSAIFISPEPVLSIGEIAGTALPEQFSIIGGLARLSDGRIVVLESQGSEVRWFDPTGGHLYTRGGEGRGPGEFNYAVSLFRIAGDTVVVEDRPRVKHVVFSPEGTLVREAAVDHAAFAALGSWAECADFTLPDQSRVVCQVEPGQQTGPAQPGHHRRFTRFVRVSWDLSRIDTLGIYGGIEQWGLEREGRPAFAVHSFHSFTHTAFGGTPLRIAIALNPAYRIELWSPDGRLDRVILRRDGRRAPTSEEVAKADEALREFARGDEALANRFVAEVPTPDSLPAVADLAMGEEGDLWVRRTLRSEIAGEATWDVFDSRGQLLGEVTLPGGFTPHEIGQDYVLGVRLDELFVPYVEMYALRRRQP